MASLTVLIEGYYVPGAPAHACSTAVLVRAGGHIIVVDPGTVPDPRSLLDRLAREGLAAADVSLVILTHAHADHSRQAGLFAAARLLDAWGSWQGDAWDRSPGPIDPDVELVRTPGHSDDSLSVFVRTSEGEIAICGDVIYDAAGLAAVDPFATDPVRLRASRALVLDRADFVVPGHGPMFKVQK